MRYDFARYLNIRSAINPVLSPDGQRVAFLSDITGDFQVWSVNLNGSAAWPQQLTFFDSKVWDLYGPPAASHLLAVSDINGNERQQFYLISNYGLDAAGEASHDIRRLTPDSEAIHRFGAWSKDGQRIVYTSNARNGIDFDYYRLDIPSGQQQLLGQANGNQTIEAWSPDEKTLLVAEAVGSLQVELYLFDLQQGTERHVTAQSSPARYRSIKWVADSIYLLSDRTHDRGALCRLDVETGALMELLNVELHADQGELSELELLTIAPDQVTAAYILNVNGYSRLFIFNLATGTSQPVDDLPAGVIGHLSFSADSTHLTFDLQTPTRNPDVWLVEAANRTSRQLTFSNTAGIPRRSWVQPEEIQYRSFDDLQIPAFYYRPQAPAPESGYPCILYVHGGPASQLRPDFDVRFQYFLSRGYAILATNVRGSTGYGRKYTALDEIERRMDSVTDLRYAVQWLQAQPEIEGDRIAIYGRSYGGFMVLAALTEYPDLFAAGIDVVGIANWVTFLERTSAWRRSHREKEYGSLTQHRALLEKISPIHKAGRINVPLMVLAGDNDPRVPLSESEQIVEKVRAAGNSVEFIHYADEGHKFSKLVNRVDSFTQMADFLQRYL